MLKPKIRLLSRHQEYRQCERLQKAVWGGISISSELMVVTQKLGGVILGAWLDQELAGFIYAFLGRRRRELIHWSHMMAVAQPYRDHGLGFKMKLAHRRLALQRGIRSIGWTYDPLQSRNAALNLTRLGARVEEYVSDCYGRFSSIIEKGLPSDRFVVNWPIASAAIEKRLRQGLPGESGLSLPRVNQTSLNPQGLLENRRIHYHLTAPELLLEIPSHTDVMRERNLALARRWRLETRRVFQRYFSRGYEVKDFIPPGASGAGRCFYVLSRKR